MITYYEKLVRDGIPKYLEDKGIRVDYKILEEELILLALIDKLKEELDEFFNAIERSDKIVELADIQEVLNAFTFESGFTIAQREQARVADFEIVASNKLLHINFALDTFVHASSDVEKLAALAYMQQSFNVMITDADITLAEVDRARFEKLRQRGAFLHRIYLISTEE